VSLILNDVLAHRVIDDLQFHRPVTNVARSISAKAGRHGAVINMMVTNCNPAEALKIADSAAVQIVQMVGRFDVQNAGTQSDKFTNLHDRRRTDEGLQNRAEHLR